MDRRLQRGERMAASGTGKTVLLICCAQPCCMSAHAEKVNDEHHGPGNAVSARCDVSLVIFSPGTDIAKEE